MVRFLRDLLGPIVTDPMRCGVWFGLHAFLIVVSGLTYGYSTLPFNRKLLDEKEDTVDNHFTRVDLPGEDPHAELTAFVNSKIDEPFSDDNRARWHFYLLFYKKSGTTDVVCRVSHAIGDGITLSAVLNGLFDTPMKDPLDSPHKANMTVEKKPKVSACKNAKDVPWVILDVLSIIFIVIFTFWKVPRMEVVCVCVFSFFFNHMSVIFDSVVFFMDSANSLRALFACVCMRVHSFAGPSGFVGDGAARGHQDGAQDHLENAHQEALLRHQSEAHPAPGYGIHGKKGLTVVIGHQLRALEHCFLLVRSTHAHSHTYTLSPFIFVFFLCFS